jgi:hypothetical protein
MSPLHQINYPVLFSASGSRRRLITLLGRLSYNA